MEASFIAKGLVKYNSSRENNNFALIAILVTLIAILVTIYCCTQVYPYDLDPGNFCHSKNQSTQHLTDTRSTQVYPSDLDPGNYFHSKNQSTQIDQLQQRDLGVQTVPCSQSSSASQTTCYLDITSSFVHSVMKRQPVLVVLVMKLLVSAHSVLLVIQELI